MDKAICVYTYMYTYKYTLFFFFLDRVLLLLPRWLQTQSPVSGTTMLELTAMCHRPWFLINIPESGTIDHLAILTPQ